MIRLEVSMVSENKEKVSANNAEEISYTEIGKKLRKSDREQFVVFHMDVRNNILSYEVVAIGSLSSALIEPREVFKAAILSNASKIILMHNHPSGDPDPSMDDIEITKRLQKAGYLLNIPVIDHIIVSSTDMFSFAQKRMLDKR